MNYPTPHTDKVLKMFTFKTKEGILLNDTITQGQKEIMECILTKRALDGSDRDRVHCEAHTRYGKSMAVGAAVAVRSSSKNEPWALIGPTLKQSQIIMDYVIEFSLNDPLLAKMLAGDPQTLKNEHLKEHKKKNHITYLGGGEVRCFTAGNEGDALMGFGSPNVVEDECYLINDNTHSKVIRMLGDNPQNSFLFKIGNPWNRSHGLQSRRSELYFNIIIDYKQGLEEGRLTESFLEEVRSQPNFGVLYECIPPDEDAKDEMGYIQLFSEKLIRNSIINPGEVEPFGKKISGFDVGDTGPDSSVIVNRWINMMRVEYKVSNIRPVAFAGEVAIRGKDSDELMGDGNGPGAGCLEVLESDMNTKRRTTNVNFGAKSPDPLFANYKAWLFWQFKIWLEKGGKLEEHDSWSQLLNIKYRVNERNGKVEIITKKELRSRGIPSPDSADAAANTFAKPSRKVFTNNTGQMLGGVDPFSLDLP